jgi:hypothetical protein
LAQLPHQKKKYDSKSKHCGARPDLGTTPPEADQGFFEVRRAKINGVALIFDVRPRTGVAEQPRQHICVEPVNTKCPREGQRFLAPQIGSGFGNPQISAAFRPSDA